MSEKISITCDGCGVTENYDSCSEAATALGFGAYTDVWVDADKTSVAVACSSCSSEIAVIYSGHLSEVRNQAGELLQKKRENRSKMKLVSITDEVKH